MDTFREYMLSSSPFGVINAGSNDFRVLVTFRKMRILRASWRKVTKKMRLRQLCCRILA